MRPSRETVGGGRVDGWTFSSLETARKDALGIRSSSLAESSLLDRRPSALGCLFPSPADSRTMEKATELQHVAATSPEPR